MDLSGEEPDVISFIEHLMSGRGLVGDGAIGTQLMERGLRPGQTPEIFNLEKPDVLAEIATLYVEAGAEIVTTNTFGASPLNLRRRGLEEETEEINRSGVLALRESVGGKAFVSGSVGPTGAILRPYGDTEEEAVHAAFLRQAEALTGSGVDLLCVETMVDVREASLAVRAARAVSPTTPLLATMTFESTPRGFVTIMGNTVEEVCRRLEGEGADLLGANCGFGIEPMCEVAGEFVRNTRLPVVVQSNAGLPETRDGRVFYPESPEFMAGRVAGLLGLGVAVIGGCCGTTPEHIRAIRNAIDAAGGT